MIITFTYLVPLDGRNPELAIQSLRSRAAIMVRHVCQLRGMKVAVVEDGLELSLRFAGHNRWNITGDARRILTRLVGYCGLSPRGTKLVGERIEKNRRDLTVEQGRTEMTRRPRAERAADGRPWDHIAWWGDDLTQTEDVQPSG